MAALTIAWVVVGIGFLATRGVNWSTEFTGGTLVQVQFKTPPRDDQLRSVLSGSGVHNIEIQPFGSPLEYTIKGQAADPESPTAADSTAAAIRRALAGQYGDQFSIVRREYVGPRVGSELQRNGVIAVLISFVIVLAYLAIRFEWRFGLAAVVATAHDIVTTIAFLAMLNLEVSLTVVAALLTVIGYSLNDTIIIFDRIRENLKKQRRESLYDVVNRSINETLPRSILTHATTLAATFALLMFAGEVIRPFAWVMTFGIFTGTFSSIYVAGALLLYIERRWPRSEGEQKGTARALAEERKRERGAPMAAR
jgi:preprotein translocase subunit SecF